MTLSHGWWKDVHQKKSKSWETMGETIGTIAGQLSDNMDKP